MTLNYYWVLAGEGAGEGTGEGTGEGAGEDGVEGAEENKTGGGVEEAVMGDRCLFLSLF